MTLKDICNIVIPFVEEKFVGTKIDRKTLASVYDRVCRFRVAWNSQDPARVELYLVEDDYECLQKRIQLLEEENGRLNEEIASLRDSVIVAE